MKDWIMELCPEIAEWQADLIAEQAQREVAAEREACAIACEVHAGRVINDGKQSAWAIAHECADAIRARGQV